MNVKNCLMRLAARIPQELPASEQELDRFISEIINLYNLPNTPAYQRTVAKAVHGVSQSTHKAPKHLFYAHIRRFEAMMAAVSLISELEKKKQAATSNQGKPPDKVQEPRVSEAAAGLV